MPLVLIARAVALLPWFSLRRAGALIGALVGSILRVRRAQVEAALRRAGLPDPSAIARAMYASLGTAALEFLWMVGRPKALPSVVSLTPRAHEVLRSHGVTDGRARGVVIATAHTGNWDLIACAVEGRDVPLAVLTKKLRVDWLDRFWQRERASRGIELLQGEGAFRDATRALAHGRSVAVLIDQAPERNSAVTRVPFLGEDAYYDLMPTLLAARTGAPLILALGHRKPDGTHSVDVPLVLEPPPRCSRAWLEDATRQLSDALEVFIREHPSQWLWLHRRWKPLPPRAAAESVVAASPVVC
jgi:Kdo2-lipid IVA lauroyltransferase/acyltransferase